ncbi:MAG: hypothetical protein AAF614_07730 [Chloroflexota bacterium]
MTQTVILELPDETWQRLQQSATAARKDLPTFIIERLDEATPATATEPANRLEQELDEMAHLDDEVLWEISRSQLPPARQDTYDDLLERNHGDNLSSDEAQLMEEIGREARLLTAKKAQAFMLLKWRGHHIPNPDEIE